MKTIRNLSIVLLAAAASATALFAKIEAGPKGGRLLETEPQKAEFFVNKDRKVEITFYDSALKPVAPAEQVIAITAEPKSGRAKLDLEKTATGFVSKQALPEADEAYRVVVQVREKAGSSPKNFRVDLNLETCGECKLAEYACTCEEG
jgi:hypothetical protein